MKSDFIAYFFVLLLTSSAGFGCWYFVGDYLLEQSGENRATAQSFLEVAEAVESGTVELTPEKVASSMRSLSAANASMSKAFLSFDQALNKYIGYIASITFLQALLLFGVCFRQRYNNKRQCDAKSARLL